MVLGYYVTYFGVSGIVIAITTVVVMIALERGILILGVILRIAKTTLRNTHEPLTLKP